MKKALIVTAVVAVLGVLVYFTIFNPRGKKGTEVYLATAEGGAIVSIVSANGEIQPRTKVNISSNIPGEIVALPVREGDIVSKGQVLVRIDQERYAQEVESREASLRMARVAVEQEQTRLATLESQMKRAEALRADQILPEETYENTLLAYQTSKITLKSLAEAVSQTEAALAKAKDELAKTVIFAPMDGKVTQLNTEVGEQVIVGTTNIPGSVLMIISDMSEVLAEVDVDETEVVKVRLGQPATVRVDAVEGVEYRGHVNEIRNSATTKGDVNVFGVKIQLDDPDARLRPGMSARARIEIERRENVIRVPIQAVVERTRKDLRAEIAKAGSSGKKDAAGDGNGAGGAEETAPGGTSSSGPGEAGGTGETGGAGGEESGQVAGGTGTTGTGETAGDGSEEATTGNGASATVDGDSTGEAAATGTAADEDEKEVDVVYVVVDGRAQAREVTTGLADETNAEILSGLESGDRIVTGPYRSLRKLKQGDAVSEKEEPEFTGESSDSE